jgi:ClpX C4-type zinc finger
MPTLRFQNPQLHERFLRDLSEKGFQGTIGPDGTMSCSDEQWNDVNSIAHHIRDSCFPWYFSWFESSDSATEFETHLRERGFRFEIEEHGDRLVFILPKEDEGKHGFGDETPPEYESCSFCGKSYTDVGRFFVSKAAAICDECVVFLHEGLADGDSSGSTD